MGLDDLVNKATDALGGKEGAAEKIDQASEFIQSKTDDNVDGYVEKAADAAKDYLDK